MHPDDLNVRLRPRPAWEAADLGLLLARRHAGLLGAAWACTSLPCLALLSLWLRESPGLALLLFWWLKPLFERLTLHILARALFGATPRLGEALRAWPGLLRGDLWADLTWRRASLLRSFARPVAQLEGLHGAARRERLQLLAQRAASARWLTLLGLPVELLLWLALAAPLYLLLPSGLAVPHDWQRLLAPEGDWLWLEHLGNWLYALVLILWGPCYSACGFALYLNRRCELEAWDLELAFRRLAARLGRTLLLLALALLPLWTPTPALAAVPAPTASAQREPDTRTGEQAAARREIAAILAAEPFRRSEERLTWRWRLPAHGTAPLQPAGGWLRPLTGILEALLWGLLAGGLGLLVWRYREWRRRFVEPVTPAAAPLPTAPPRTASPAPPAAATLAERAGQLWTDDPRAALALLYAGLLEQLRQRHALSPAPGCTEGEVLALLDSLDDPPLDAFARPLLQAWQALAWGGQYPDPALGAQLCAAWRDLQARMPQ